MTDSNQNNHLTIGFLNASGLDFYQQAWSGISDVAREQNINAINFVGNYVRDTIGFKAQANILYDLINVDELDGLVIQDLMCSLLSDNEARRFYNKYRPLPIVSIGRRSIEGIPCIQSHGYLGMRNAIIHLIETHNRHRIAFIKGLPNYRPHDERFEAYVDVLKEYGLPYDPSLVANPQDAAECEKDNWGQIAVCRLLDEQNAFFDALVTNDDRYAHKAIPELQARDIHIPGEISIASFDDEEGSYCFNPPLTTVPIPIYDVGRKAAETLIQIINGIEVSEKIVDVPSDQLIIRQSCGCLNAKLSKVVTINNSGDTSQEYSVENYDLHLESILSKLYSIADKSKSDVDYHLIKKLVTSLILSINEEVKEPNTFLFTLDDILRQTINSNGNIEIWQNLLFALRHEIRPFFKNRTESSLSKIQIEDLWLQAQILIDEIIQRTQAFRELKVKQRRRILNSIGTSLATNFEVKDLRNILTRELPRLGISRGFISLYENPIAYQFPQKAPKWSQLVVAFDQEDPDINFNSDGDRFISHQLAPYKYLQKNRQYNLIVVALYFQQEQIGIAVFEEGPRDGMVYELLQSQISSVLKGALLLQEAQLARKTAEKADQVKTRLLANVSHELRTPLNIILGYTQDALESSYPQEESFIQGLMGNLHHIRNSAEHQLRVVNDLLDLSRAEIDELDLYIELINPQTLFKSAFESISHSVPSSDIEWVLQMPDRLPFIQADPVRLQQILLNLLSNAYRFTKSGCITLGVAVEPPNMHIWVKDTGEGIPQKIQDRIFEPFVTAEYTGRRPEGIGLGLSITRRLIALHNGSLELVSTPGAGSTFHVFLPLPNLADKPTDKVFSPQSILLLLSGSNYTAPEIIDLCQRQNIFIQKLNSANNLDNILASSNPVAVAWDLSEATSDEWMIFRRLKNHPHLNQVPFILYGQGHLGESSTGLTGIILKPINPSNLLDVIKGLDPLKKTGPILIVDDDQVTRESLQKTISTGYPDYYVHSVNNGVEAVQYIKNQIPCLIILDLMMPEMNGFDVLDAIRIDPLTYKTPVVILTSKILTLDDIKRIEQHTQVIIQSKGILDEQETISALHRSIFGTDSLPATTSSLVKRAIAFIHQNYSHPIARWEIAKSIGVTENYFTNLFNKEIGVSPWDYLNRFRINQSKELLRRTNFSIKIIAKQVGFKDQKYFSRVFKKTTGYSPNDFRDRNE